MQSRLRLFAGPPEAPVLLFFHGNGETARDYDPMAARFAALGVRLWIGEYRGYGPATGRPSLDTFLPDAVATLAEARRLQTEQGASGPLVVMGRSLGSAPAIEIAHACPDQVAGLIIESGFARIVPLLELIGVPARRLGVTEEIGPRNHAKMAEISMPSLILHAERDEIIPFEDAELLFEACRDPGKVLFRVPGAGHNDIQFVAGRAYFDRIGDLLERIG